MSKRKNPALEALRAEAMGRHKAATRKVSRLRSKGVEMNSSEFDPRKPLSVVRRYNSTQLNAYINRVNEFISRGNQFVPSAHGTPIPSSAFNEYKKMESQLREQANSRLDQVRNIKLPNNGMTVGERLSAVTPSFPTMRELSGTTPQRVPNLSSRALTSLEALKKLKASTQKKLAPGYYEKRAESGKASVKKMLDEIGDTKLAKALNKLSAKQFEVLWTYSPFASVLSLNYEYAKALASKNVQAMENSIFTDSLAEANQLIGWASKI